MSQPLVPPRPGVSPSILRRLRRLDVSHDFDVIGDAPPPRAAADQAEQPVDQAAQVPAARAAE
ncbi:MAG: hypothetical protein JNN33_08790 [Rhodospirillaceae bacterium]|nr:hypothetical protein [Rhodospirillaceae bacterium]